MMIGRLGTLPPQLLPKGDLVDSVFITIWWFAVTCFAFILSWLLGIPYVGSAVNWLFPRSRPTWSEFRAVCLGTWMLSLSVSPCPTSISVFANPPGLCSWYLFTTLDRWLRYDQR